MAVVRADPFGERFLASIDRFGAELQWDADLAAACVMANIATAAEVPPALAGQAEAVLREALSNVVKHAAVANIHLDVSSTASGAA